MRAATSTLQVCCYCSRMSTRQIGKKYQKLLRSLLWTTSHQQSGTDPSLMAMIKAFQVKLSDILSLQSAAGSRLDVFINFSTN